MTGQQYSLTGIQLGSALIRAIIKQSGLTDKDASDVFSVDYSSIHFHDDSQAPIAWNDVQAITYFNEYTLKNQAPLLPVPEVASEGYNQHHHTGPYDGGVINAVKNPHSHQSNSNKHGGFAFAVFAPAVSLPMLEWE